MQRIPRFPERSLHSAYRRAGLLLRRFGLNRFLRDKRVRLIRLNGKRYKRLRLPDSYLATTIARNLERFQEHRIFPRVIAVLDRELLLEFVEGAAVPKQIDAPIVDQLARFFSIIYEADRREVKLAETAFARELREDLDFLTDVSVLEPELRVDLEAAIDRISPNAVWVGYDFMDPLPKNFIVATDGRLVAIDVEDLLADQLIGGGIAKVLLRLAPDQREQLLDALAETSSLDLGPALPFIELRFLTRWTKHLFLKGRSRMVEPQHFEAYR